MAQVDVNGLSLRYDESGAGEPLILLHGLNADRRQFDCFRPHLGDGIRAIAPDQRDGPDSPFDAPYAMADHADDAAELIAQLCGGAAHVFGTSYGGAVAMTLAIRHPHRVKTLTLGATAPCFDQFKAPDVASVAEQGAVAVRRFVMEHFFTPDAIDHDRALMQAVEDSFVERSPQAGTRRMAAMKGHDVRDRLSHISAPTLVLQGEFDPIIAPEVSRSLAGAIPGARLAILPGVRHGISMQGAGHVAGLVRDHVLAPA
ncbi:alpha/beta fold hydrolase [Niveispirillum sp. KHB5.9]|uniref:alpha/beta fold hydrolase n=1 Tax=Niveispirillum sp. KHB5.9 TaxID=3400269 RepID=UPI003A88986D